MAAVNEVDVGDPDAFLPVKSAQRALGLLNLIARERDGMNFSEIQRLTGWPRSSTYNLLRTMTASGHLDFDEAGRVYRIGLRTWEAGQAFRRTGDLDRVAQPLLRTASERLNETVQLAILDGFDNVYAAKVEADQHLKLVSEIGSRLPAYATGLGKVLLAGLEPDEFERRLSTVELRRFTDNTIVRKDDLRREIDRIRDSGYAVDRGEFTDGVFCVAVPVRDAVGHVVAAMSCSVPEPRLDPSKEPEILDTLLKQADGLSSALGNIQD